MGDSDAYILDRCFDSKFSRQILKVILNVNE
jgi:hypothetical protein